MLKRSFDAGLGLLLFLGSFVYLYYWPRDLYGFDEGLYLYEAKRILSGEVMYRDFFDMVTPVSYYWMALLFGLFGVSMETARVSMAILHGLIVVFMYLVCREMGVRRGIAVAAATWHVAVFYPALTIASPHWCSTFLTLVLLYLLLRGKVTRARSALLGALAALLIWTQQQKGLAIGAAVVVVMILDHLSEQQPGVVRRRSLTATVAAYVGGLLAVSLPIAVSLLVGAGFGPVYEALVLFPLRNYRPYHENVTWAAASWLVPGLFPKLMALLPLVVPLALIRAAWQWIVNRQPNEGRPLRVVAIVAAAAIAATAYNPNYIHLAVIGPVWLPLAAETLDAILRWGESRIPAARIVRYALVVALLVSLGARASRNMERRHALYPVSYETAFGWVHFQSPEEFLIVRQLAQLSADTATHEIFVYPCAASLYLLTNSSNPTRLQLMLPGYNGPDQIEEALTVIETRKVPFVARNFCFVGAEADPLRAYLKQHYEPVKRPYVSHALSAVVIFRRKSDGEVLAP